MMGILIIDDRVEESIQALVDKAMANIISLESLKRRLEQGEDINDPATRSIESELVSSEFTIPLPQSYTVTFTVEQHPRGLMRHLSLSCDRLNRTPATSVVREVALQFGFKLPDNEMLVYTENYAPGRYAVNLIQAI